MKWSEITAAYFSFTRRDMVGITVVLLLIILVFLSPKIFRVKSGFPASANDTAWITVAKKLEKREIITAENSNDPRNEDNSSNYQYDRRSVVYPNSIEGELFPFDPNTLTPEEWQRLGLKNKTIKTIQNYLSKGGHFYKAGDLSKIYGLHKDEYARLEPYIRIQGKENIAVSYKQSEIAVSNPAKPERYKVIDINEADTTAFIALPGIGSKLAARIVNFRDKLGGFYSVSQVAETFGLPDSTFQKIKQYLVLENLSVKKININTATIDELKAHPYIKYSLANPIVAYRNAHGPFAKAEDVKKVMAVTEEAYNKIAPYLSVQ